MRHTTRPIVVASLALVWIASSAQAQQTIKVATRDEYRWCLDEEDRIRILDRDFGLNTREHAFKLKVLQDEIQAHVAQQADLNTTDKEAVDTFNKKLQELNARGEALNKRTDELNEQASTFNSRVASMNKKCAGMVVNSKDREAVLRERTTNTQR